MNIRALNALRKIAAEEYYKDTNIPSDYLAERELAWEKAPKMKMEEFYEKLNPGYIIDDAEPRTLENMRRRQSIAIPATGFGLVPGTNDYNLMRQYLLRRGRTNFMNYMVPEIPAKNPEVPEFEDKKIDPKAVEAWGNTMANQKGGFGNNRIG